MKTHHELYAQKQRMSQRAMRVMRQACRRAHPETEGHPLLVHNWGNPESKAADARHNARWHRIADALDARYAEAEHRNHAGRFSPLWCEICNAGH